VLGGGGVLVDSGHERGEGGEGRLGPNVPASTRATKTKIFLKKTQKEKKEE
jgi:hypothetical protein